jgi:hypothetical protein
LFIDKIIVIIFIKYYNYFELSGLGLAFFKDKSVEKGIKRREEIIHEMSFNKSSNSLQRHRASDW